MKKVVISTLSIGLCLLMFPVITFAETATTEVKGILDKAMAIQTDPALQGDEHRSERAEQIRTLIDTHFSSEAMAKSALDSYWDKIDEAKREEFKNIFAILFQDSYTRMVLNFLKQENIEYRGETNDDKGVKVETVIMRANEHIPVDYFLFKDSESWLVSDVTIDDVSIVKNYRNAFRKVIQNSSFDNLLEKMRLQSKAVSGE